ncbi:MauE/DoxX family redox-associated membrane protein [Formosa haliotis]|uniref:MauE/DoxX family redox-associated membrane protein n=1 Tax=Formosa haliotis TaxID=1555194 RepID=UPI000AB803A6
MKWVQKHRNFIIEIISNLLVVLFLYAAISKLINFEHFSWQLSQSPYISPLSSLLSWLIPVVEILIAITLISKKYRTLGLYSSLIILTAFTLYIFSVLKFSDNIPCSCGGVLSNLSWKNHLIFNLAFILFTIFGILFQSYKKTIARLQEKTENL